MVTCCKTHGSKEELVVTCCKNKGKPLVTCLLLLVTACLISSASLAQSRCRSSLLFVTFMAAFVTCCKTEGTTEKQRGSAPLDPPKPKACYSWSNACYSGHMLATLGPAGPWHAVLPGDLQCRQTPHGVPGGRCSIPSGICVDKIQRNSKHLNGK